MVEEERKMALELIGKLGRLKEVREAEKPPLLQEIISPPEHVEPAEIREIKKGSGKDLLIQTFERVLKEADPETVKKAYEHAGFLAAGLQEINPHHVPRWLTPENPDARKRVKKLIENAEEVRKIVEQMPKDVWQSAAGAYIALGVHPEGIEVAKSFLARVAQDGKYQHVQRILRFGKLSREAAPRIARVIANGALGEHEEEILDAAEEALWKALSYHKKRGNVRAVSSAARKIADALEAIGGPEALQEIAVRSKRGKEYTLLQTLMYNFRKIAEEPHNVEKHAQNVHIAVSRALRNSAKRRGII